MTTSDEAPAERLPRIRPAEMDVAQLAVYESITGGPRTQGRQVFDLVAPDGSLHGPFNAMLLNPLVGDALQRLGSAIRFHTGLDPRVREACILLVANALDSEFEQYAHEAVGTAVGLTPDDVAMLRNAGHGALPFADGSTERLCIELVLKLIRDERVDDAFFARCADELGRRCVFELNTLVGYYRLLATQLDLFGVRRPDMTSR